MSLIKKKIKKTHIAGIAIASLFSIALIVGDCFAYKYSDIISTFLGVAEQLTGNDQSIEESAKTADGVVRKIADEGVVLLKNKENNGKPTLPLQTKNIILQNPKKEKIFTTI